ncbi:hypothetical protein ACIG3E_32610 [Streptomyces sp. NPDC053474]|uniref:hypothetical protein n=1 Tax=Streptomyces sp. NPDC053474 TaxID=3365704 RepID=UPI0037CFAB54
MASDDIREARVFLRWGRDGELGGTVEFPAGTPRECIDAFRRRVAANGAYAIEVGAATLASGSPH